MVDSEAIKEAVTQAAVVAAKDAVMAMTEVNDEGRRSTASAGQVCNVICFV